jgi:hypothetical protein
MKIPLLYGLYMTLAGFVLTLVLYFLGFHTDAAKLPSAQWISNIGLLVICVTFIVLGTKAQRAQTPLTEDFGYGRALWTGVKIAFFAALFGIVTNFLYTRVINPGFTDVIVQAQLDKMEAKGMSSAQIEQAEKGVRFFMGPIMMSCFVFIGSIFWGTLLSLITAAFLKRKPVAVTPLAA